MGEQWEKDNKRKTIDSGILNYYDDDNDDDVYQHEDKKPKTNDENNHLFHRLKEVEAGGDSDNKGQIVSGGAFVGDDKVEDDFKKDKGKANSEPRRLIMSFSDYQQYALVENREQKRKERAFLFMKNSGYNQPKISEAEVRKMRDVAEPEGSHMLFIGRIEPILPDNPMYKKMPDILIPRSE